jgi:hypothetical protein
MDNFVGTLSKKQVGNNSFLAYNGHL